jgi:4-amino-4-deoxy-L-arabinose transferase-like glycosyltransferase
VTTLTAPLTTGPDRGVRARGLWPLAFIVAARLALGLAYSQAVPAWEAYDEDGHFAYARYLAVHHSLVLQPDDPEAAGIWERFQPPLYYNLIAPVLASYDLGAEFTPPARNLHFVAGDAGYNYALHPAAATPSEQALAQAVRAGRAVSVVLSSLSVVCVYFTARRLWPGATGAHWAATSLFAFWPQWVFVGSMITNDGLVTTLTALGLLLAVQLVTSGLGLRRLLVLASVAGLALLTKLTGAVLVPTALAAAALSLLPGLGRRRWTGPRLLVGLAGLAAGVAGAFWVLTSLDFVTSQVLQAATLNEFIHNLGPAGSGRAGDLVASALPYAFRTFWASFGWGNLETAPWLYWVWDAAAVTGTAGLVLAFVRRRVTTPLQRRLYGLLGLNVLTLLALTLALAIAHQNEFLVPGRYLLPTLPAVVLLLVGGWRELGLAQLPRRARRRAWQAMAVALPLVAWAVPLWTLLPAYARPTPLSVASAAAVSTPHTYFYGGQISLLGYSGPSRAEAGAPLTFTLCWQAIAAITQDYTLFVEIIGADNLGHGRLLTYPGHGNYPTSAWAPNQPFCEQQTLLVQPDIPAPALARVRITLLNDATATPLPVTDIEGQRLPVPEVNLELKVNARPNVAPSIAHPVDYRFGSAIRLTGYALALEGSQARVTLRWQAAADVNSNYVAFVHLRDTPETEYAQGDSLPRHGAYPTWLWRRGETLLDEHLIDLPPVNGPAPQVDLYVGLFDVTTFERVPVYAADGQPVPNYEVILERGIVLP